MIKNLYQTNEPLQEHIVCSLYVTVSDQHSTKRPGTTMLTYPWKCTVLHCNHLGNTWKPLVLMTRHFDYCPSASEGNNQSVRSSAPVVSRCFPGGYNVKLYISRGRLAWWLLAFLHSASPLEATDFSFSLSSSRVKSMISKHCIRHPISPTSILFSIKLLTLYNCEPNLPF